MTSARVAIARGEDAGVISGEEVETGSVGCYQTCDNISAAAPHFHPTQQWSIQGDKVSTTVGSLQVKQIK